MLRGINQLGWYFAVVVCAATAHASIIGGNPIVQRVDQFGGPNASFSAKVYTSVYFGAGNALPNDPMLYPLSDGETAFVYVIVNDGESGEVDLISLVNPETIAVPSVGYLSVPVAGLDNAYRVTPHYIYGGSDSIQFMFNSATTGTLGPGEWTALTFRGLGGYAEVPSFVGNLTTGDIKLGNMLGAGGESYCSAIVTRSNTEFPFCLGGPNTAMVGGVDCQCSDFDLDDDVDLNDFSSFQRTYNKVPDDTPVTFFGGEPVLERIDTFGKPNHGFTATIYTAVYQGVGSKLPTDPILFPIQPNETVFIYLIQSDSSSVTNIDLMTVLNPNKALVPLVGTLTAPVAGFDDVSRIPPSLLYGGSDSIQFGWQASQQGLLQPGQWAVVAFRALGGYKEVNAYVGNLAVFKLDFGTMIGPSN